VWTKNAVLIHQINSRAYEKTSEKKADVLAAEVGGCEVDIAVSVEVSDNDKPWSEPGH
jgi:hypothetical protein